MKKVLALVLAVIMVCTMAMAVDVTTTTTPEGTSAGPYAVAKPGTSLEVTFNATTDGIHFYEKDGKFVPANNVVTVTFAKGGELVASQGWVKDGADWKYVLTTKEGVVAADGTPDIIIASIVVSKTGVYAPLNKLTFTKTEADGTVKYAFALNTDIPCISAVGFNTLKAIADSTNSAGLCLGFDYGYLSDDIVIAADGLSITAPATLVVDTIYTVKRTAIANAKSSVTLGVEATASSPFGYFYTLKAGESVMYTNIGTVPANSNSAPYKALYKNLLDHDAVIVANSQLESELMPSKAVTLTYDGAKDSYKMYMVKADGSVVDLNAKFDANKVLTATATLTGPVIVTDKALTATGTAAGSTTTNPGTGANDVVGVAAALAVVALVSGAAISLKK